MNNSAIKKTRSFFLQVVKHFFLYKNTFFKIRKNTIVGNRFQFSLDPCHELPHTFKIKFFDLGLDVANQLLLACGFPASLVHFLSQLTPKVFDSACLWDIWRVEWLRDIHATAALSSGLGLNRVRKCS